jgi:hypothetical protein
MEEAQVAPFYNSYFWAKPACRDANGHGDQCRGRHTVVPGAGQQFARGLAAHRPLSRPLVGSTQESRTKQQTPH